MSSKNQKYTASIDLQAKADFSQLIKSLNSVYDEIRSKADSSDLAGVQKTLDRMSELQVKLKQINGEGISSPKELKDFHKIMDTLMTDAKNLDAKFQSVSMKTLKKDLAEAKKELNRINSEYNAEKRAAENLFKTQLKGVKNSELQAKKMVEAVEQGKSLENIEKDITNEIDKQINKKKEDKKTEEDILTLKRKQLESQKTQRTSITEQIPGISKDNFYWSKYKNKISESTFNTKITPLFKQAIENSNSWRQALKLFRDEIQKTGIEIKNLDLESAFSKMGTLFGKGAIKQGIEQTNKEIQKIDSNINNLNNDIEALEAQKEDVGAIFSDKNINEVMDVTINKLNQRAAAQEKINTIEEQQKKTDLPEYLREENELLKQQGENTKEVIEETSRISEGQQAFDNFTQSLQSSIKQILSITTSWRLFRQAVIQTYNDVKDIDKSFAQIAMVTNYSVSDMWGRYEEYAQLANRLGQSTQSVIEASGLYYQQGKLNPQV